MFLTRQFHLSPGEVGNTVGVSFLVARPVATLLGGFLVDRSAKRCGTAGKTSLMIVLCGTTLASSMAPFMGKPAYAFAFLGVLQDLSPAPMRGLAVSLCGLTNAIIGATSGPMLIAFVTKKVFRQPSMVGYSIAIVLIPTLLAAAICFWLVRSGLQARSTVNARSSVIYSQK